MGTRAPKQERRNGDIADAGCNFETAADCNFKSRSLDSLAVKCIIFLAATVLISFVSGAYLLTTSESNRIWAIVLIGASGSAVAALTSCLNRYANGFEDEQGHPHPKEGSEVAKERFNRRMAAWLFVRPILGAVVAPIFIWGLAILVDARPKPPSPVKLLGGDPTTVGFTAFMAGLLAKSVLEEIKNLFDRLFGATRSATNNQKPMRH